ncbi:MULTISPECIES: class I ribonucleotide reductase maintenance protein YfaE [Salinivibrio]|uniref:(2Fe-2S)-binding protein n=1 Tax=Salinivibrio siamensis TaxID=414286 RepID=A0ABX3K840_9GAMM|nr:MULTISPECIES: class I ribonucleotide reductase maintenance protein YfaE [Salinivibrio]KKA46046.1 (2Fe-2S)-binding protein [Salinivibrio sp. KP-1]MPS32079.1 (2Fe-2S)-binding protein [Salinivibrio sp. VYel7]MPX89886.1 2Fe-2S iron-sulfur cluster binding domain-containing protein [Salinivibrio sp. VYel1]MPX93473.1 2Fe-2S iron-sulfur cluster binding domain-containing protein [Salinivibrio sp. VYel9]MPX95700.1 2Fe-2S iron-sulfur cluster binding domain-containing protein [Salinivibrio sp. VYel6]
MTRITIEVNGITVGGNTHQNLLEQLEDAGIQPEYQCRNGMCGACRCKLNQGSVTQGESMAFVMPGEILACQSAPQTDVSIAFDYQPADIKKQVNEA